MSRWESASIGATANSERRTAAVCIAKEHSCEIAEVICGRVYSSKLLHLISSCRCCSCSVRLSLVHDQLPAVCLLFRFLNFLLLPEPRCHFSAVLASKSQQNTERCTTSLSPQKSYVLSLECIISDDDKATPSSRHGIRVWYGTPTRHSIGHFGDWGLEQ